MNQSDWYKTLWSLFHEIHYAETETVNISNTFGLSEHVPGMLESPGHVP